MEIMHKVFVFFGVLVLCAAMADSQVLAKDQMELRPKPIIDIPFKRIPQGKFEFNKKALIDTPSVTWHEVDAFVYYRLSYIALDQCILVADDQSHYLYSFSRDGEVNNVISWAGLASSQGYRAGFFFVRVDSDGHEAIFKIRAPNGKNWIGHVNCDLELISMYTGNVAPTGIVGTMGQLMYSCEKDSFCNPPYKTLKGLGWYDLKGYYLEPFSLDTYKVQGQKYGVSIESLVRCTEPIPKGGSFHCDDSIAISNSEGMEAMGYLVYKQPRLERNQHTGLQKRKHGYAYVYRTDYNRELTTGKNAGPALVLDNTSLEHAEDDLLRTMAVNQFGRDLFLQTTLFREIAEDEACGDTFLPGCLEQEPPDRFRLLMWQWEPPEGFKVNTRKSSFRRPPDPSLSWDQYPSRASSPTKEESKGVDTAELDESVQAAIPERTKDKPILPRETADYEADKNATVSESEPVKDDLPLWLLGILALLSALIVSVIVIRRRGR